MVPAVQMVPPVQTVPLVQTVLLVLRGLAGLSHPRRQPVLVIRLVPVAQPVLPGPLAPLRRLDLVDPADLVVLAGPWVRLNRRRNPR